MGSKVFLCYHFRRFAKKACKVLNGEVLSQTGVEEENLACRDGLWPEGV